MANRNITLSLPEELVRKAKIHAASRDTTINAYVRTLLDRALSEDDRVRNAGKRFLEIAEGLHSNVDPGTVRREDLYERW